MDNQNKTRNHNYYKENNAIDTVKKIRKIIMDLDFEIEETDVNSGVNSWSVNLKIYNLGSKTSVTFSSGKGNTLDFARASAYGEMIERMQSDPRRIFRNFYDGYNKEVLNIGKYIYTPEEKQELSVSKYMKYQDIIKESDNIDGYRNIIEQIEEYAKIQKESYGYIPLPKFINANTGGIEYINEMFLRMNAIGSTGFCAGNSKYEALLQGLCEIEERYVKYLTYQNKISFPIIPKENIKKYKYSNDIINQINDTGRYEVEVRDASMEGKFNTVVVIIYDKVTRGYVVNYGTFPVFEIALDRTINEILQGKTNKNINTTMEFKSYELENILINRKREINSIEITDDYWFERSNKDHRSIYPDNFFTSKYDYKYTEWGNEYDKDNETMFYDKVEFISKELNDKVLYADYSHLGFPTYSIICPKMTYLSIYKIRPKEGWCIFNNKKITASIFNKKDIEQEVLFETVKQSNIDSISLSIILGKSLKYEELKGDFLTGIVMFKEKKYMESANLLGKYIPKPSDLKVNKNEFFRIVDSWICMRNYISMLETIGDGYEDKKHIHKILCKMFPIEIVEDIANKCADLESLLYNTLINKDSLLNIINWDKHNETIESFKKIQYKKEEYYNRKGIYLLNSQK